MIFKPNFLLFALLTLHISFSFSCENNDQKSAEITPDIIDSSVLMQDGLLTVSGNKIVNKNNEPVSFSGNSFFVVTTTGVVSDFIISLPLSS